MQASSLSSHFPSTFSFHSLLLPSLSFFFLSILIMFHSKQVWSRSSTGSTKRCNCPQLLPRPWGGLLSLHYIHPMTNGRHSGLFLKNGLDSMGCQDNPDSSGCWVPLILSAPLPYFLTSALKEMSPHSTSPFPSKAGCLHSLFLHHGLSGPHSTTQLFSCLLLSQLSWHIF